MQAQFELHDPQIADWHLDDRTREVGRQGIAEARQALRAAAQRDALRRARRGHHAGQGGPGAAAA